MPDDAATPQLALAHFIKANASFDGGPDETCPKCKHVISHGRQWFKHTTSLASKIARHLGFGRRMAGEIEEILMHASFTGAVNKPSVCYDAAVEIWEHIYA